MTSSRRAFLKDTSLAVAGLSLFPNIIIPRMKDKLGVALVGLGSYSTNQLAPALQQTTHCYLAGIVTGTQGKIPTWQKRYTIPDKNVYTYNEIPRIADNPDIDVLYIVLPPSMHSEYCIYAANIGKHVWCEKPMAINAQECEAAINSCKSNKVSLAIGYRMHMRQIRKRSSLTAAIRPMAKSIMSMLKQVFLICEPGIGDLKKQWVVAQCSIWESMR